MPLIVGEWSLATDNCAMWLNGFNDNLPGYPKVSCRMFPCAAPYMGYEQPGTPPSNEMPLQGPYGTGVSGPQFGQCPVGVEWGDRNNEYMTTLTMKSLNSFNSGHGWFFWNFRTEMEPRWSFIQAYYNGWFPGNVSDVHAAEVVNACPPPTVAAVALPEAVAPTAAIAAVALGLAATQPAATSEATSVLAPTSTPRGVPLLAAGAVVSAVAAASALVARQMRGARREALLEDLLGSSRADSDYASYGQ
jgi:glucan 1,3-beta-glucosidase